ncbi:MAG: PIN domain-containing protein [Myxococcales bacterium]|nr:PIN domain-containing protein [Myxococcales bacterium]
MKPPVLIDTGPLVAALRADDDYHEWSRGEWQRLDPPLLTCEPVLTEALFLLRHTSTGAEAIWQLVDRGVIQLSFQLQAEAREVARLMKRYANVPMSLADACLVRMSELHQGSRVLTLDGDFKIYRRQGRKVIPTISPR